MLLSSSECFQFFFSLEGFTGRGRKALRAFLFPLVQKSYPCLSDSVAWDFTVFRAGKKRWALVSAAERETLAVIRLKNPRCALYTLSSCVCRSKDFYNGKVFACGNDRVFFDTELQKPCFEAKTEKKSAAPFTEREILSTCSAVQVFSPLLWNTNGTEKKRTLFFYPAVLFLCITAAVLVFALSGKKKEAFVPVTVQEEVIEEKEQAAVIADSAADYLCECGRALYADGAILVSFRYEQKGKLNLAFKSRTPSQVVSALEGSGRFSSVQVKSMVFEGEKALCSLELMPDVHGSYPAKKGDLYPETVKEFVLIPRGGVFSFSGSDGNTLLSFEADSENIESCIKSVFGCEEKEEIRVLSLEINSENGRVPVKCVFEAVNADKKENVEEYDFSFLSALFPAAVKPTVKAAPVRQIPEPETEPEQRLVFVGKTRGTDGSYTYFYKSEDGKIVSEKKYESE